MQDYIFYGVIISLLVHVSLQLKRKTSDCFAIMKQMQASHEAERETWKDQYRSQDEFLKEIWAEYLQPKDGTI